MEHNNLPGYRILSLDGGGSWAIIQVLALQKLYKKDTSGHSILKDFDLVVANSGGSIVLAALAANFQLDKIVELLEKEQNRKKLFAEFNGPARLLAILHRCIQLGPKYYAYKKLKGLKELLGQPYADTLLHKLPQQIGGRKPDLLIMGFDYDRKRSVFFRSNRKSNGLTHVLAGNYGLKDQSSFEDVTLAEAVHASSNAPVNYFNGPAMFSYATDNLVHRFWDGGVAGYNNPIMAGITEALCNGKKLSDIIVRSIGTGQVALPVQLKNNDGEVIKAPSENADLVDTAAPVCFFSDVKKLAESILDDPPDAATFIGYTLLEPSLPANSNKLLRANPLIQPIWNDATTQYELPKGLTLPEFKRLKEIPMDATKQEDVLLIKKLAEKWIMNQVPNQAIRTTSFLKPLLGCGTFKEIESAWFT